MREIFSTNPEFVTPLGIRLAHKLNSLVYKVSVVKRATYDIIKRDYDYLEYRSHKIERTFVHEGRPYLPFPSNKFEYSVYRDDTYRIESAQTIYRFELNPLRGGVAVNDIDQYRYDVDDDYVKELVIRQVGEAWRKEGEAEMRKFLESISLNDNRQIHKVSFR